MFERGKKYYEKRRTALYMSDVAKLGPTKNLGTVLYYIKGKGTKGEGGILLTYECCSLKYPLQILGFYSVERSERMFMSGKKISVYKKMIVIDLKMFIS